MKSKYTHQVNPLIDKHPVDTLLQIQSTLIFVQDYIAKIVEQSDISVQNVRTNAGLHAILKTVNAAIDYEIDRLENYQPLSIVK